MKAGMPLLIVLCTVLLPSAIASASPAPVELTVDAGSSATPLPLKIGHCVSQHKIGGVWIRPANLNEAWNGSLDAEGRTVIGFAGMRGAGLLRFPNGNEASEGILLSAYFSIKWGLGNASDGV